MKIKWNEKYEYVLMIPYDAFEPDNAGGHFIFGFLKCLIQKAHCIGFIYTLSADILTCTCSWWITLIWSLEIKLRNKDIQH